jgi:hypothetical protein
LLLAFLEDSSPHCLAIPAAAVRREKYSLRKPSLVNLELNLPAPLFHGCTNVAHGRMRNQPSSKLRIRE